MGILGTHTLVIAILFFLMSNGLNFPYFVIKVAKILMKDLFTWLMKLDSICFLNSSPMVPRKSPMSASFIFRMLLFSILWACQLRRAISRSPGVIPSLKVEISGVGPGSITGVAE